jgi:ribosomal-protein-alanine N-acetyltransferase
VSGLVVERAEADDLPVMLEIERASYSHPWTPRNFEGELRSEHGVFLVLREAAAAHDQDRGVRAYCAFRVVAGEMHLMNLTVGSDQRRRGTGRFLLGLVLDLGKRRGASACFLEVRESNAAALGLYRTAGFEEAGRRKGYYRQPREDALLLRRALSVAFSAVSGAAKEP